MQNFLINFNNFTNLEKALKIMSPRLATVRIRVLYIGSYILQSLNSLLQVTRLVTILS